MRAYCFADIPARSSKRIFLYYTKLLENLPRKGLLHSPFAGAFA